MNTYLVTISGKDLKPEYEKISAQNFSEACEAAIKLAEHKEIRLQGIMIVKQRATQ